LHSLSRDEQEFYRVTLHTLVYMHILSTCSIRNIYIAPRASYHIIFCKI